MFLFIQATVYPQGRFKFNFSSISHISSILKEDALHMFDASANCAANIR